jgi:hypothetical protein
VVRQSREFVGVWVVRIALNFHCSSSAPNSYCAAMPVQISFDGTPIGDITLPPVMFTDGRASRAITSRLDVTSLSAFTAFAGSLLGGVGRASASVSGTMTIILGANDGPGLQLPAVRFSKEVYLPDCRGSPETQVFAVR